jgi:TolB-like protein/class 3 adenylate cyclase
MYTDIVGYTALTQTDEAQTLAVLERHNRLLRPIFPRFHGREVKAIGDSFLVEFESALDALKCATEIQSYLHDYNASSKEEWKIKLRIGIHLGDVIHQGGDVFGDAVNIASRIYPLAEPEGVCVSDQVFGQIRNKVSYPLEKMAPQSLKNVQFPVDVYKVIMPWEQRAPSKEESPTLPRDRIAILPFANMSPDPNDQYFADGMTEEIISTVSGISGLNVISRTSVMGYKGTTKKVEEIGKELKAGSVLEGSFRKAGNRIRVTTQLIDVAGDRHLWAQNYDRNLDDIFEVQSDVAKQVADALKVQLLPNEKSNIEKKATESTEAYTLYLRGRYHWNEANDRSTKEGFDKAVRYFQSAIALDPQFALGYAGLSDCYHYYGDYLFLKRAEAFPKAREYATKAIELDPNLAEPHASLGAVLHHYYWDWNGSEKELVRAIELKPSYALAHFWYNICLQVTGRFKEAYEESKRAAELDPLSKENPTHEVGGLIYLGRVKEAIELAEKTVRNDPEYFWSHRSLGISYFCDGRTEDAIAELRKATALSGNHPWQRATLATFLARAGKRDEATAILRELVEVSKTQSVYNTQLAEIHYSLGQRDEAFDCLERAYEEREWAIAEINYSLQGSDIRKDPRWASFQKRLGLPPVEL